MKQILLLLFIVFTLAGCGRSDSSRKESRVDVVGVWSSPREYRNDYFGFRVAIPDGWELKKGTSQEINQRAVDFLAGDEKNLRSVMKSAIERTQTLFWAYRYPIGTPGKSNPNVSMLIENVTQLPGVKSSDDYLLAIEQTFRTSNKTVKFLAESRTVDLGGVQFMMRESEMPMGSLTIHQKFYATMKDRLVLLIGVTTMADGDTDEVAKIMQSIKVP
jgi:galactokinase/mevalonate kinase-like predicted kinase